MLCRGIRGKLRLLAGAHILDFQNSLGQLIVSDENNKGNADFIGIAHFCFKLLILAVKLSANARLSQKRCCLYRLTELLGHGDDQSVARGSYDIVREHTLLLKHKEKAR